MSSKPKNKSGKRKIVWLTNLVVAALCLLSILCYFFAPVWQIKLTYVLSAEDFHNMVGDQFDFDVSEVIDEDGEPINAALSLTVADLYGSFFSSAEESIDSIVAANVDSVVAQLSPTLMSVAKKTVKSVAKQTVKSTVKDNIHKYLNSQVQGEGSGYTEEEVEQKLNELGFTDEYIGERTDELIESVFSNGSDVDTVTDEVMKTVDEVYADFKKNSQKLKEEGKEGYEDFENVELTPEEKEQIESTVRDTIAELADENGNIDAEALVAELLLQAMNAGSAGGGNPGLPEGPKQDPSQEEKDGEEIAAAGGTVLLAETEPTDGNTEPTDGQTEGGSSELKAKLTAAIKGYIPAESYQIIVWIFRGMAALILLSMLPWAYILLKLLVKLATGGIPTVKLALPIWLGWLFFLLLVAVPSILFLFLPKFVPMLQGMGVGADILGMLERMSISVASVSWITALCALLLFVISIFYMVMRRKIKKDESEGERPEKNSDLSAYFEDIA